MKKKGRINSKDYQDWINYTKEMKGVHDKELDSPQKTFKKETRIIDLHGLSLQDANSEIEKFIYDSIDKDYQKIKVITGKGTRSKNKENPYMSSEFSILKNSIPEFVKNNSNISRKIKKIYTADIADGGEGAFYILLKNPKE